MARMTLAEIKARPSTIDWTRVNATTDGDIDRQAKEDGTEGELPGLVAPSPETDPEGHCRFGGRASRDLEKLGAGPGSCDLA